MFRLLIAFLVVSSLALAAKSQFSDFPLGILNPDLIYFNNGVQRYPLNVLPVANRRQEVQNSRNDNYVPGANKLPIPVNMIPDGPVGPGNVNLLERPSIELTPPVYKPNTQYPQQEPQNNNNNNNNIQQQPEIAERFAADPVTKTPNIKQNIPPEPVDNVSLAVSKFGIDVMKVNKETHLNNVTENYYN